MADQIRKAALQAVSDRDTLSGTKCDEILASHQEWDERDRSFFTALVETTLENLFTIDAVIAAYSKTRIRKLASEVLGAIEIALSQILFMDRVPDHAACDESVRLVKKTGSFRYSGFANGIIRNVIRDKSSLSARVIAADGHSVRLVRSEDGRWKVIDSRDTRYEEVCATALRYSYPCWIVEHFMRSYGGAVQILEGLTTRGKAHALVNTPGRFVTKEITDPEKLVRSDEFRDGRYYIMNLSSMQPVYSAADFFPEKATTLDLCAAPGGKSIEAAILYDAHITACDVSEHKTAKIKENVSRMHLENNITVVKNDATVHNPAFDAKYDVVIADVPCSGLGVSGRKPDIRLHITPQSMDDLSHIQGQITDNASCYVKQGGTLIYSTCTLNPAENEEQVRAFVGRHNDFILKRSETIFPDGSHDGFYYAVLQKL